ncbi:MAG TPA: hypothetical protein PKA63_02005 [Oligoflexia bacterium]|nr:hypothetical protein [Oligoflexia bacterium]HMP47424.1 hypothetical protein [Oligoflexia bacterium]
MKFNFKNLIKGLLALALVLGSFDSIVVQAQPVEGNSELQLNADFFAPQGSSDKSFSLSGSYGVFVSDDLEVGIRQSYSGIFPRLASSQWLAVTSPFFDYHIRGLSDGDTILPYIGGFLGLVWNDRDTTGTVGPNAGVKFFVAKNTFLNMNYRYEWFFDKFKRATDNRSDGNHVGQLGIGFLW